MTVYVVQEVPNRNVLPAQKFGELILMLPPGDVVLSAAPTVSRLKKKLKDIKYFYRERTRNSSQDYSFKKSQKFMKEQ